MNKKEAIKIIKSYDPNCFDINIEDTLFGDGSKSLGFYHVFDSKNEAEKVATAIQILLTGSKQKIIVE